MRAAIYIRVSTSDQNYDLQRPSILEYCRWKKITIVEEYAEEESAWKQGRQKELTRLIKSAQAGNFDVVVVWALDRLTREGPAKILALVKKLQSFDVRLFSLQEPWTEAPGELGELLFAIVGWVAQQESKRRSERTKLGIERRRNGHATVGRPHGSKDTRRRSKQGYKNRWIRERAAKLEVS